MTRIRLVLALAVPFVTPSQPRACSGTFCDNTAVPMPVDQRGEDNLFVAEATAPNWTRSRGYECPDEAPDDPAIGFGFVPEADAGQVDEGFLFAATKLTAGAKQTRIIRSSLASSADSSNGDTAVRLLHRGWGRWGTDEGGPDDGVGESRDAGPSNGANEVGCACRSDASDTSAGAVLGLLGCSGSRLSWVVRAGVNVTRIASKTPVVFTSVPLAGVC